jgi:uncharacterized membrane protein
MFSLGFAVPLARLNLLRVPAIRTGLLVRSISVVPRAQPLRYPFELTKIPALHPAVRECATASLLAATQPYAVLGALLLCAASAQALASAYRPARALSAPVLAMLLAALLANASVLPPPPYDLLPAVQAAVTRIATPLLLLDADLSSLLRRSATMAAAFAVATVGTALGSVIAFAVVAPAFPGAWQLCAAVAAKNIGGGATFLAVADTYRIAPAAIALALNADNLLGLIYFPLNAWMARSAPKQSADTSSSQQQPSWPKPAVTVPAMTAALAFSLLVVSLAQRLCPGAPIPAAAAITVAAATAAPKLMRPLANSGGAIGALALYLLFACAGAAGGKVSAVLSVAGGGLAPATAMVAYCCVLYAVHLCVVVGVGILARWWQRRWMEKWGCDSGARRWLSERDLALASNAAIGGPATAAAMAEANGWDPATVSSGILIGNAGNAIGAFVGLSIGNFVLAYMN